MRTATPAGIAESLFTLKLTIQGPRSHRLSPASLPGAAQAPISRDGRRVHRTCENHFRHRLSEHQNSHQTRNGTTRTVPRPRSRPQQNPARRRFRSQSEGVPPSHREARAPSQAHLGRPTRARAVLIPCWNESESRFGIAERGRESRLLWISVPRGTQELRHPVVDRHHRPVRQRFTANSKKRGVVHRRTKANQTY